MHSEALQGARMKFNLSDKQSKISYVNRSEIVFYLMYVFFRTF